MRVGKQGSRSHREVMLAAAHRFRGGFFTQTSFNPQAGQMIPFGQSDPSKYARQASSVGN